MHLYLFIFDMLFTLFNLTSSSSSRKKRNKYIQTSFIYMYIRPSVVKTVSLSMLFILMFK